MNWDDPLPPVFCEGKLWKGLVPGFDEFFSGLSGVVIIIIALFGMAQPRLEVLTKMMYAGMIVSGVGTMMLHWKTVVSFNLADVYPLLITLTFGIIAFFDELIFEFRRTKSASGNILPVRNVKIEVRNERIRMLLSAIFYTLGMLYLVAGLILYIYSNIPSFYDIYFAVPFAFFAIFGMIFLTYTNRKDRRPYAKALVKLSSVGIITGLVAIAFKIIDSAGCNTVTIWIFPHVLFHIFLSYSTHCVICFLTLYRSNNYLLSGEGVPSMDWHFHIFPMINIPMRGMVEHPEQPDVDISSAPQADTAHSRLLNSEDTERPSDYSMKPFQSFEAAI